MDEPGPTREQGGRRWWRQLPSWALPALVVLAGGLVALGVVAVNTSGTHLPERKRAGPTPEATPPSRLDGRYPAYAARIVPAAADVRERPGSDQEIRTRLPDKTENGAPQTLLVLKEVWADGRHWYKVLLPVRPNGSTGWLDERDVSLEGVEYRVDVHLRSHSLDVFRNNGRIDEIPVGLGKDDTPTPGGLFYVMELLRPPKPDGPYGTYAYVLNGYSNQLTSFNGGTGLLGVHGTNQPELIGKNVSHGCIRMTNENIERLAQLLPLGTPVRIMD